MEDGGTPREPTDLPSPTRAAPEAHHLHHSAGFPKGQDVPTGFHQQSTAAAETPENVLPESGKDPNTQGGNKNSNSSKDSSAVAMLEQEVLYLRQELASAREQIRTLQDHERQLRDRLVGQAQQQVQMGGGLWSASSGGAGFEDLSLGSQRPTELIRKYGELYLDSRVEALDALDRLAPLQGLDMLKLKILFSVVVLSFKAAQQHVGELRGRLRHLLGLPVPSDSNMDTTPRPNPYPPTQYSHAGGNQQQQQVTATPRPVAATPVTSGSESPAQAAAVQMEHQVTTYLCRTAGTFEVAEIVFEVCQQIYATLYDYPCLKACPGLLHYVSQCVRVAWGLCVQRWPYSITYDSHAFQEGLHARFHTSDPAATAIKSYLWPSLLDSQGACVSRAVVIT